MPSLASLPMLNFIKTFPRSAFPEIKEHAFWIEKIDNDKAKLKSLQVLKQSRKTTRHIHAHVTALSNLPAASDRVRVLLKMASTQLMNDLIRVQKTTLHEHIIKARAATSRVKDMLSKKDWSRYSEYSRSKRKPKPRESLPKHTLLNESNIHPTAFTAVAVDDLLVDQKRLLNFGPSFSPPPENIKFLTTDYKIAIMALRNSLVSAARCTTNADGSRPASILDGCPFPPRRANYVPPSHPGTDARISILWRHLSPKITQARKRFQQDLPLWDAINSLRKNKSIRVSVGDKCGAFVVTDANVDRLLVEEHLSDATTYSCSSLKCFNDAQDRLKIAWTTVVGQRAIPRNVQERISISPHARVPVFYPLLKTHKINGETNVLPIRPIISGCGGPTDAISWLLVRIISPLLDIIPAHLRNVGEFLSRLSSFDSAAITDICYESFDVVSLYTNVSNQGAITATINMLKRHQVPLPLGMTLGDIESLLTACLQCNVFVFSGKYYAQHRGLAMGNRLAPLLAVTFMHSIERECYTRDSRFLYVRYIDDVLVVSTRKRIDNAYEKLCSKDGYIRFTRETPDPTTGKLPFLNTSIWLDKSTGRFRYLWYRKPMRKNLLLHGASCHPTSTKKAVRKQLLKQALSCSDPESQSEARSMAKQLLLQRPLLVGSKQQQQHGDRTDGQSASVPSLIVPFINDTLLAQTRAAVDRAGIQCRIVSIPPPNLRSLLTDTSFHEPDPICPRPKDCIVCPNVKPGACMTTGTIYRLTCECGQIYVGETGRPLHTRIREHMADIRTNKKGHWKDHHDKHHDGSPCSLTHAAILAREKKNNKRKAKESLYIGRLHPQINNKDEQENCRLFLNVFDKTSV